MSEYACTCEELRLAICVACVWPVVFTLPVIPAQLIKSGILYWPNILYVHVYTGHPPISRANAAHQTGSNPCQVDANTHKQVSIFCRPVPPDWLITLDDQVSSLFRVWLCIVCQTICNIIYVYFYIFPALGVHKICGQCNKSGV